MTAARCVRRAVATAGSTTTRWSTPPPTAACSRSPATGRSGDGAVPRRARRRAGGRHPTATGWRSCSSATTPATSPWSTLDGLTWPRRVSHADYAWDPTWSSDGRSARMARVGSPEHAVGRVAHHDRRGRRARRGARPLVAGGDDVAVGQPRFAPDGDALAFVAELDGWMNVWTVPARRTLRPRACSPSRTSTPSRRGVRASGRSRGRPTRVRSRRPQRGRLRSPRRRGARR